MRFIKHSNTSNLIRFTLKHSTTGAGLTGLAFGTSGLIISTICNNEATPTVYNVVGTTIETITTLGTFETPTATKCRFKEVDATNHPGLYEFQIANARFAVASARTLVITVSGAANLLTADYEILLTTWDPHVAIAQTGDNFARIGATGSGLTSLAQASVCTEGRLSELDAANLPADLTDVKGATFVSSTDSLEAIRDRGDAAWTTGAGGSDRLLMVDTTIATLASQTSFTLTAGSADDDAYNNCTIVIEDVSTATQKAVGLISDYTGASKTVTLKYDPAIFTMAATDKVYILAENALKSTAANRQLDVTATGAAGIDWANVENPTTAVDLSATDIKLCDTVTTLTGHTPQTADHTAAIAALPDAAAVKTAIEAAGSHLALIKAQTDLVTAARMGALTDLIDGGRLDLLIDAVKAKTDLIVLNDIADAILKRDFSAVSGEAARSLLNAVRFLRNKWSVSGGTLTITKEDDTTSAWTSVVTGDAAANPIVSSDPA